MINTNSVSEITTKFFAPKVANYVLSRRYCAAHAKEFIGEDKPVAMIPGICEICSKGGIVFYED